jgi:amino-acid N-acetyltransferase
MTPAIDTARPGDLAAIEDRLVAAGLPVAGVGPLVEAGRVLVARDPAAGIMGCVAVEPAGGQVLLRSLAVSGAHRRAGIGDRLVSAALATVTPGAEVWVLTETAEGFFTGRGFTPVDRRSVTGAVTATELWTTACPASAVALRLDVEAV